MIAIIPARGGSKGLIGKNIKLLSIVLLVGGMFSFGLVTEPNHAVKNNQDFKWEKLGSRKVNMVADHDEILVTAYKGFFTKIKFKVLDAPILLRNVKVIFGNGEFRSVKVNKKPAPDLPGQTT